MARGGGRRRSGGSRDKRKPFSKKRQTQTSKYHHKNKKIRGIEGRNVEGKHRFSDKGARKVWAKKGSTIEQPRVQRQPKSVLIRSDSESEAEPSAYELLVNSVSSKPKTVKDWCDEQSEEESDLSESGDENSMEVANSDSETGSSDSEPSLSNEGPDDDDVIERIDGSDEEYDAEEEETTKESNTHDPFSHFEQDLDEDTIQKLSERSNWKMKEMKWPVIGRVMVQGVGSNLPSVPVRHKEINASVLNLKPQLYNNLKTVNKPILQELEYADGLLTSLQEEVYCTIANYHDLYYSERSHRNGEELRLTYCLHALNHILKTRSKVIHHNAKLTRKDDAPDEYRDQGLTRPKVLIIVPFREMALRVVKLMIGLFSFEEKTNVINKKRFQNEYGSSVAAPVMKARQRPDDYDALFVGNTDDMFRIGLAITKKSLKLFADFYAADIIIASPLGLRTVIGAEGEKDRDYDFLSAIEVLVMDQADVFMMQNWEHILHVFDHLHLQPQESHGTDFSRVRMWSLNGWSKYYRQTIILSSVSHPAINAVFNKNCWNYAGKLRVFNSVDKGTICNIVTQLPQVFRIFSAPSSVQLPNVRFQMFTTKILPQFKNSVMGHTLVYIPSYFDFVRVRNFFKKEELSFVQICEYSKEGKIARARDYFFHGKRRFLLYTERAHFFHRYAIKGIRHIIFYELPTFPGFYSELCNMLQESRHKLGENSYLTCNVLYAAQDAVQLSGVVGKDRATVMLNSDRGAHMFVTGET